MDFPGLWGLFRAPFQLPSGSRVQVVVVVVVGHVFYATLLLLSRPPTRRSCICELQPWGTSKLCDRLGLSTE